MSERQSRSFVFPLVGVAVLSLVVPLTYAQVESERADRQGLAEHEAAERVREAEARRLADAIIDQRQALSGRPFGPGYRETVLRALLDVPIEALRQIEREGTEANPRAAIEAARTPDPRSEAADDLLPLPAQLTEPSAVSGVAQSGSVFVPVPPCRLVDTRLGGGALVPGSVRGFVVTGSNPVQFGAQGGNASGCGIPPGTAVSAFVNFVAVSAPGTGHLRTWAYATPVPPPPLSATLNYALAPAAIANGVTAPLCDPLAATCTYDILAQAFGSETHVVADVLGYFRTPPTSFPTTTRTFTVTTVGVTCTHYPGALVFVDAPAPGKVLVRADVQLRFDHVAGTLDTVRVGIGSAPTDCTSPDSAMARMHPEPSGLYFPIVSAARLFTLPAPGGYVFFVNGFSSGPQIKSFWEGKVQATYHPD